MIEGLTNADSIPVLERMVQFAGARHRMLAHDIANVDTPHFRPVDVDPAEFQARLAEAVDARREERLNGHARGIGLGAGARRLRVESDDNVTFHEDGIELSPRPIAEGILFHDGNDRDPERLMQRLVENFMAFRSAADLLRSRFDLLNTAIRERL